MNSFPLLGTEQGASADAFASRLRALRGTQSRRAFAQRLGITESTLRNYEQGASVPNALFLAELCTLLRVRPEWFLFGTGEMRPPDEKQERGHARAGIPVTGMAGDVQGWYTAPPLALRIPAVPGSTPERAIAVLVAGTDLLPEGGRPACVLICDHSLPCLPGDLVFVRRTDDMATIRLLTAQDSTELELRSWHPPDEHGRQRLRIEHLARQDIAMMAPVSFIKLKD